VAKRSIDGLLEAMDTVQQLKELVDKHDRIIGRIVDALKAIDERLVVLEKRKPR
jgi:hypothetical protein